MSQLVWGGAQHQQLSKLPQGTLMCSKGLKTTPAQNCNVVHFLCTPKTYRDISSFLGPLKFWLSFIFSLLKGLLHGAWRFPG